MFILGITVFHHLHHDLCSSEIRLSAWCSVDGAKVPCSRPQRINRAQSHQSRGKHHVMNSAARPRLVAVLHRLDINMQLSLFSFRWLPWAEGEREIGEDDVSNRIFHGALIIKISLVRPANFTTGRSSQSRDSFPAAATVRCERCRYRSGSFRVPCMHCPPSWPNES